MKYPKVAIAFALLTTAAIALAQEPGTVPTDSKIVEVVTTAMALASQGIIPLATRWLGLFMLLQFIVNNVNLLGRGAEIDVVGAKFLGSLLWFSFCWFVLAEGPGFISRTGTQFFSQFAPNLPSPTSILVSLAATATALLVLAAAVGVASNIIAQFIMYLMFAVVGIGLFFAIKLILLQLELGITVMMAPFNFAFLGLNATKDQGVAPFKSLMSFMFRVVVYGVLFSAYGEVHNAFVAVTQKYSSMADPWTAISNGWAMFETMLAALVSYLVLTGLLFKSDSIAASLSSGTTNLGTADVAGAAAAGAAAGAAIASGGAALAGTKPVQAMADWSKQAFAGNHAGIKNAGDSGIGGLNPSALKPDSPSMSMGGSGGSSGGVGDPVDLKGGSGAGPDAGGSNTPAAGGQVDGGPGGVITPNSLPDQNARNPARDAAREARREAAKAGKATAGAANTASIGGTAPGGKTFAQSVGDFHHHVAQEKATTQVSINTNHE